MRKLYLLAMALFATLSMAAIAGCEKADVPEENPTPTPTEKPVIEIDEVVEIAIEGGATVINYTITNPVEGARLTANTDASWITNLSTQIEGNITFVAASNNTEQVREAVVELFYSSVNTTFIIRQLASGMTVDYGFEASLVEQSYHYCTVKLEPESMELSYVMDIFLMEDIEAMGLVTDDDLYDYIYDYYDYTGSMSGLTGGQVLAMNAKKGVRENLKLSGLKPDSKCLFIAFYFDTNRETRISDIYRFEFNTLAPEIETLGFEYDFKIEGPTATAYVTPDNNSVYYYFDVMPCSLLDEVSTAAGLTREEYLADWWKDAVYNDMLTGTPASSICQNNCSMGAANYTFDLLADTEYYIFAFGVNDQAVCNTVPQLEVFKTGTVDLADLSFEFEVSNLTKCGVKIDIKTSNSTDSYVAGLVTAADWAELGSTDAQRLPNILDSYNFPTPGYGDSTFEEQKLLTPNTEYVFFTFGYLGGVATTMPYSVAFKTLEDIPSDVKVSVKNLGYFDVVDINMYMPDFGYMGLDELGYAIMPVEFDVTDENTDLYFYSWVVTPDFDLDWVTDSNRFGRYLYWGTRPEVMWTIVAYDTEAWVGAMGCDSEGYYTEEYLDKRPIKRSGVGDAIDFVEWLNAHPEAIPDPSQYINERLEDM